MEFIPVIDTYAEDTEAQVIWSQLSEALGGVDGLAFYRHPTLGGSVTSEVPDLVVLARGYQPLVIRILRESLEEIHEVTPKEWSLADRSIDNPFLALEDFSVVLRHRFEKVRPLRHKVAPAGILWLPHITEREFGHKFPGNILEDSGSLTIWKTPPGRALTLPPAKEALTDPEWRLAKSVFQSASILSRLQPSLETSKAHKLGETIRALDRQIALLDTDQLKASLQIAPGPQRIRGLAGTGKTVLLALKAATIHSHYPTAKVLFTFHTQSLYNQAQRLITKFYRMDHDADPDWDHLHLRHAWGSRLRPGVYYDLSLRQGQNPMSLQDARALNSTQPFQACCQQALGQRILPQYRYILVDEGQDLPSEFFQVLYSLSEPPHAIFFAYDELQNLGNVELPKAEELFGRRKDGKSRVSLEGEYPGGIEKDLVLRRSYRCPREVLMVAHAVGLGLYSPRGPVQMLADQASWEAVGYVVEQGPLTKGNRVILSRPNENSPSPITSIYEGDRPYVRTKSFETRKEEIAWLVEQIVEDISVEGVNPQDIVVVFFNQRRAREANSIVQHLLFARNILSVMPGISDGAWEFGEPDRVTLTTPFRAKGNEAPIVYLYGCEQIYLFSEEIELRNKAFTSISRSKGWVTLSGKGARMDEVKSEVLAILTDIPKFKFDFPDMKRIRRLDAAETTRRRQDVRSARKSVEEILRLDESALGDLDPDQLEEVLHRIQRAREARGEA